MGRIAIANRFLTVASASHEAQFRNGQVRPGLAALHHAVLEADGARALAVDAHLRPLVAFGQVGLQSRCGTSRILPGGGGSR